MASALRAQRITPLRARVYSRVTPFGERVWAYEIHEDRCAGCCTAAGTGMGLTNNWRSAIDSAFDHIGLAEKKARALGLESA